MSDEEQIAELRVAVLDIVNSDTGTKRRIERLENDIQKLKLAQTQISKRLENIENLLDGQNGNSENKK